MKQWLWIAMVAAVGCGSPAKSSTTSGESAGAGEALAPGDYGCSFGGYPEYLCRVTEDGDARVLEKLGGSERYRGALAVEGDAVRWTNAGAGDPPVLTFRPDGDGAWKAEVPSGEEPMVYRLRYLGGLGSQFGGEAYAGAISEPAPMMEE